MNIKLLGAVAIAALSVGVSAHAADYLFTNTSMTNPDIVHIVPTNENVYMAPMDFSNGVMTIEGWCLDVMHSITLGHQNPALDYKKENLTNSTSLNGNAPFSDFQIGEISYLINVVAPTVSGHALNAVQGGIWDIILGGVGNVTTSNVGLQAMINTDATLGLTSNKPILALESTGLTPNVQDFGVSVPEPATWALMILGFGTVGAMLRDRRRKAIAA